MKADIYTLLGMIKDNKAPKKIEYCGDTYRYVNYDYISQDDVYLFQDRDFFNILNDEVEILEITLNTKDMNISTSLDTQTNYYQVLSTNDDGIIRNNIYNTIEKLEIYQEKNCKNNWKWKCNGYNISAPQKIIADKINEIIEVINGKDK